MQLSFLFIFAPKQIAGVSRPVNWETVLFLAIFQSKDYISTSILTKRHIDKTGMRLLTICGLLRVINMKTLIQVDSSTIYLSEVSLLRCKYFCTGIFWWLSKFSHLLSLIFWWENGRFQLKKKRNQKARYFLISSAAEFKAPLVALE